MLKTRKKTLKLNKIIIPDSFKSSPPRDEKAIARTLEYANTGKLGNIYVDENYRLFDGYISYLIAKAEGYVKVKVVIVSGGEIND